MAAKHRFIFAFLLKKQVVRRVSSASNSFFDYQGWPIAIHSRIETGDRICQLSARGSSESTLSASKFQTLISSTVVFGATHQTSTPSHSKAKLQIT
jgi:hypothetical protein